MYCYICLVIYLVSLCFFVQIFCLHVTLRDIRYDMKWNLYFAQQNQKNNVEWCWLVDLRRARVRAEAEQWWGYADSARCIAVRTLCLIGGCTMVGWFKIRLVRRSSLHNCSYWWLLIVHKWIKEPCIVLPFTGKSAYLNETVHYICIQYWQKCISTLLGRCAAIYR